jgi:hypothetical protein
MQLAGAALEHVEERPALELGEQRMAKLGFYGALAAATTSLVQFALGSTFTSGFAFPFNSGALLALLELTLLLLLIWVGTFAAQVARRSAAVGISEATVAAA